MIGDIVDHFVYVAADKPCCLCDLVVDRKGLGKVSNPLLIGDLALERFLHSVIVAAERGNKTHGR